MTRRIITIAPPTPNGDLHLGHIAGPYMAADVYTRLRRQRDEECVFLCYSDDYQSYVWRKARELDVLPQEFAATNGRKIADTLHAMNIDLDCFQHTGESPLFPMAVTEFYQAAVDHGAIQSRVDQVPYFPEFDVYGYESYARGRCNFCGSWSDPSQCENCANAPVLKLMTDLHCTLGKATLQWRDVQRDYLCLSKFRDFLQQVLGARPMRPALREYVENVLNLEDLNWFVSRPHECGAPITLADGSSRVIHTWFSGVAGYLSTFTQYAAERGDENMVDRFWRDPQTELALFLGFDCSFSHAIVYPALLKCRADFTTNVSLFTNHFLKLDGEDFSTSRNHAIWARDIVKSSPADAVRLYLASVAPEFEVTNYASDEFAAFEGSVFGRLLPSLRARAKTASARQGIETSAENHPVTREWRERWQQASSSEHFSMRSLGRLLREALAYLDDKTSDDEAIATLLGVYAVMGQAIHPRLSADLCDELGTDTAAASAWLLESVR